MPDTRNAGLLAGLVALTIVLAGCAIAPPGEPGTGAVPATAPAASPADAALSDLSARWLDGWLQRKPVNATLMGDHRFDREVDDLSAEGRADLVAFSRTILVELDAIDAAKLSRENQVDARILRNQLLSDIWTMETYQEWAWDPQVYNNLAGNALYNLMVRDFAPLPDRLRAATARMRRIPAIFAQARANLDPARVPRIHAQTVADQNKGLLQLIDLFITPNLGQLQGDDRARLEAASAELSSAVTDQQAWLENVLLPQARGDFRIGGKLYDEKLRFALDSTLSRDEIRTRAESELERVTRQMYAIAQTVLRDRPGAPPLPDAPTEAQRAQAIGAALELAYADKPARTAVVDAAKDALAEATAFTREKDLVTVPDDPVKIIVMPEFQRGVAVAYCDSPGPLDVGQATLYSIAPIPDDWTDAQVDSFLREYNSRMIHLLSIHEAMPGHYLEGAHSARFPSKLRAVLRSGVFAEGWAVYTEQMMVGAGYHADDPLFRLVQLKFYLRTIANAILDAGLHVDGWTQEQAIDLMVRRTFQQQREAEGKWKRAQLSSTQLPTYFVGVQEQLEMRRAVEAKLGDRFEVKAYHDAVLAHGGPPVRYVRELLLDEPIR